MAIFFLALVLSIKGSVADPEGAPLAQATVRVLDAASNDPVAEATSAGDGGFVFRDLKPGKYTVTVRQGLAIRILSDVDVRKDVDLGKIELYLGGCR